MSGTEDFVRLRHMLDAARKALELSKGCDRDNLAKDEKLALALLRLLEMIGEAAKNISEKFQQDNPVIPWREIAGTRNRLIHGYFDIDLDIIWTIISDDIPLLVSQLETILQNKNQFQ